MLVSAIKNRVKRQFGDQGGDQITDADIVDWINEAQREIYTKNNLGMTVGSTPTIIGTTDYALSGLAPPLMRLFSVKYNGTTLQEVSIQDIDQFIPNYDSGTVGNSTPTHYFTYQDKISLYPPPDSVKTLLIRYNRFPTDVAVDGDSVDVDKKYENRILDYCYAQAYQLDNDVTNYQLFMQRFEGKTNNTKDDELEMAQQQFYAGISVSPRDSDAWELY